MPRKRDRSARSAGRRDPDDEAAGEAAADARSSGGEATADKHAGDIAPDADTQDADATDADGAAPAGRLVVIGTGHVFRIQDAVRDAILALRPQVVFVELDAGRLRALMQRRGGIQATPRGSWLHRRLQRFQEGIAEAYGAEAGGEMLAAVDGANLVGAETHLVDRRVEITLRRALRQLTWLERLRAFAMIVEGSIRGILPSRRSTKESVEDEMKRYTDDPDRALLELGRQFPTVRRVVIDERDEFMARRIRRGLAGIHLGIAVVGDGHVPGILQRLDDVDVTPYRLADVQGGRLPKPDAQGDTRNVRFGFDVPT